MEQLIKDYLYIIKIIDSCETDEQLDSADMMIRTFLDRYKHLDNECFKRVRKLNVLIKHKRL